ncbi:MAG: two pore domain potassium channel family protein, partial [Synechococcaceae bacterium WB9_4xB_025]|nr:two pore domain potassium channel family protein [Synechococcaceae bacterium WB9_4xB_025]
MPSARALRRRELIYELLLSLCLLVLVSFAFPQLSWLGTIGYSL